MSSQFSGGVSARVLAGLALFISIPVAQAQFKVTGPAPYSAPVARQKIKDLLAKMDSSTRKQNVNTLTGWLPWYRDIIDDELIAAWKKESRLNLPEVVQALADAKVADAVVAFSWRDDRADAWLISYAPMFEDLFIRFQESDRSMMDDLVRSAASGQPLDLSESEAETVCRILLDMPDVGLWRKQAVQILPFYRQTAQHLLAQDKRSSDSDRRDRADFWLYDPRSSIRESGGSAPANTVATPSGRRRMLPSGDSPTLIGVEPDASPGAPQPARTKPSSPDRPTLTRPAAQPEAAVSQPPAPQVYNGPHSGTLECRGEAIPQNGEYVFRNLPPGNLDLVFDKKIWEAHLSPGDGPTQKLVLRNRASGAQKRCTVHWTLAE